MDQLSETEKSPAQRRHQKVCQMILSVADRVFARDGEAGLSIRRLADEIDYSPGAIYKYFESKQELLDELKEMFFERLLDELPVFDERSEDYAGFARSSIETYIRLGLEAPHHYETAFAGTAERRTVELDMSAASAKERAFFRLYDMIRMGIERGVFASQLDALHAAKSVWAASHGLVLLMIHFPHFDNAFTGDHAEAEPPDAVICRHADFLIRGISA
jgi:AcrR family transcriptional regulator